MAKILNRRTLVLGGGAATLGSLLLRDEPIGLICGPGGPFSIASAQAQPAPGPVRIRHSLATPEGKKMLALYNKAIGRMKALPRHDPRNWYFQANIHGYPQGRSRDGGPRSPAMEAIIRRLPREERTDWIFSPDRGRTPAEKQAIRANRTLALGPTGRPGVWHSCSHFHHHFMTGIDADREEFFLPWHRMYLHYFETIAASVLDPTDPPFALPYWDYLHQDSRGEFDQLRLPAEFAQRETAPGVVNHLHFAQRNAPFVRDGLAAEDLGDQRTLFGMGDLLTDGGGGFTGEVNRIPHGQIHGAIGPEEGMGSFEFAGRDPLFWIHHAMVDRLWESWRRPDSGTGASDFDPTTATWRNARFTFASNRSVGEAMSVAQSLTPSHVKVRYDQLIELGAPSAATSEVRRTGQRKTIAETKPAALPQITELDTPVRVTVPAPERSDIVVGLRSRNDTRFYLVIDVEVESAPGGIYRAYARVPSASGTTEIIVGSFNLFGSLADPKRTVTWTSEITKQVRSGQIDPEKPLDLSFRAAYAKPTTPVIIKRVRVRAL